MPGRKPIRHAAVAIAVVGLPVLTVFTTVADIQAQNRLPGIELRANLGLGRDTNSFREATATDPGTFLPYDLRARYERSLGERSTLRFSATASGEEYVGSASEGGDRDFDLGTDWSRMLLGDGTRHSRRPTLEMKWHGDFAISRRKYISRVDGEEYAVDVLGVPIALGDRYNSKALAVGTELTLEWPRHTEWSALYDVRHRNYDEDYVGIAGVDRLDNRRSEAGFRVTQDIGRSLRLRGEYTYEIRDYYDRSVRDLQGDRVEGVAQTFYRNSWSGEVRWKAGRSLRATLEAGWATRRDPYQGYYDSQELSIGPRVQIDATNRLEFEAAYDYVHRTYDRAHVAFDALRPLRDDHDHALSVETSYKLNPRSAVTFVVEHDTVDEMNPIYGYDRTRSWAGYEVRY